MMEPIDGALGPNGLEDQAEPGQAPYGAFDGLSGPVIQRIYQDAIIPKTLFHYTSAAGLIGIISSHELWFSDAAFMNDGSESTYGLRILSLVVDEFTAEMSDAEKAAGDALKDQVEEALRHFQPIIFCMSARNNLLNQWRDYGRDVVPYCIELDVTRLENWQERKCNFPIFITKVVYDVEVQRALIMELLRLIYERAKTLLGAREHFNDEEVKPLLVSAAIEVVALINRFKNPAFEAEEEWRAICYRPDIEGLVSRQYRAGSLGAVPYYRWQSSSPRNLPIVSVTVGPSPYSQVSDLALKQLLTDHGYPAVTHFSTIPLRR